MSQETTPDAPDATEGTDTQSTQDVFDRDYVEKLRKENASWRKKYQESEEAKTAAAKEAERAKMDDLQKLQAELEDTRKLATERESLLKRERDARALTAQVVDVDAALKLIDDEHRNDDGSINLDAFLDKYAFLKPASAEAPAEPPRRTPPANATKVDAATPLTAEDFRNKPRDWVRANLHRLGG